jgi:Flp pilus assembly protein TadG
MPPCLRRLSRKLATRPRRPGATGFWSAADGVAAVEFALVLPVMLGIYLGMTEISSAVNTDRKLTMLSRTLADLAGRANTMSTADVETIFKAATSVMAPYRSDEARMVLSSIVVKATGQMNASNQPILDATVCWSSAWGPNATPLPKGTKVAIPGGFGRANSSFVRADVEMAYVPILGSAIYKSVTGKDGMTLGERTPWPVRNVGEVVWTTPCLP